MTLPVGAGPLDAVATPLIVSGWPGSGGFGLKSVVSVITTFPVVGGGVEEARGVEVGFVGVVLGLAVVVGGFEVVVVGVVEGVGVLVAGVVVVGAGVVVVDAGVVVVGAGVVVCTAQHKIHLTVPWKLLKEVVSCQRISAAYIQEAW